MTDPNFPPSNPNIIPTGCINRLENGAFAFNPEGTTSPTDTTTVFSNWRILTQTATVQTSQLSAPEAGQAYAIRITQTQSTAQRFGLAQTVAFANCADLRTALLSLSARIRFSLSANVRFALLEWDGTADAAPADVVADWTSALYVPGQFFVSNVSVVNQGVWATTANTWAALPYIPLQGGTGLNNLILFVWVQDTATQNATLDIGVAQIALGNDQPDFEYRPLALDELIAGSASALSVTSTNAYAYTHTLSDWFAGIGKAGDVVPWVANSSLGANWIPRDSKTFCPTNTGLIAFSGLSRSSDQSGVATECIGVAGAVVNDKSQASAWGLYSDLQHESVASRSYGLEVAAKNKGADATITPYNWNGAGVFGVWLAGGGDNSYGGSAANPSNAAVAILKNSQSWNTGIVFEKDSITGTDGSIGSAGTGIAMRMARRHAIQWDAPNNDQGARIASSITDSSHKITQTFFDDQVNFIGAAATNIVVLTNVASAVNYPELRNSATGVGVQILGQGTDPDVSIRLTPKGAGTVTANSPSVATEIRASGDAGGAASQNALTNVSDVTANSTGVGTIKFKGATSRDSSGFIKIYIGTVAYFVPCFSAITG